MSKTSSSTFGQHISCGKLWTIILRLIGSIICDFCLWYWQIGTSQDFSLMSFTQEEDLWKRYLIHLYEWEGLVFEMFPKIVDSEFSHTKAGVGKIDKLFKKGGYHCLTPTNPFWLLVLFNLISRYLTFASEILHQHVLHSCNTSSCCVHKTACVNIYFYFYVPLLVPVCPVST